MRRNSVSKGQRTDVYLNVLYPKEINQWTNQSNVSFVLCFYFLFAFVSNESARLR